MSEDIMTPEENDKNSDVARFENGKAISLQDDIVLEKREYHQMTSYFTYKIPVQDIVDEFGDIPTFEKACYQNYENDDYDGELDDKYFEFIQNYDYDREDDLWTDRKGGYDIDYEIKNDE